jgi:hypothetical protein
VTVSASIGPLDLPVGFVVFMTVVTAVYVPIFVWRWRVTWERPSPAFREPFDWWMWGDALWRGYVRGLTLGGGVFAVLLPLLVVMMYGLGGTVGLVIAVAAAIVDLAAGCALLVTIALVNRPRALVPPYLRHQPGAVAEWRDAWRQRHRADATGSR